MGMNLTGGGFEVRLRVFKKEQKEAGEKRVIELLKRREFGGRAYIVQKSHSTVNSYKTILPE